MCFSIKLNSFAYEIANIIIALLCMVRYLLFVNILHLAKRYSTVFLCWPSSLHLLHLASPLEAFHDFVSTIFSNIVITEQSFLVVEICLSRKLQLSTCFRNILLCICFSRYSSFRLCSTHFFKPCLYCSSL